MIKKLLPVSDFSKNVLILITGTTIAQAIPVAISPILSRLYSPDNFGVFAIFMSITGIIGSIATFRYEMAILLSDNEKDAANTLAISVIISVSLSVLIALIIVLFPKTLSGWSGLGEHPLSLYFVPVSVLSIGIYQAFNYWSISLKNYTDNAYSKVAQTSSGSVITIVLGYVQKSAFGLIIGQVTGQLLAAVVLSYKALTNRKKLPGLISKKEMKLNLVKHKTHAIVNTSHVLFDSILNNGISFLLLLCFSNYTVGLYAFSFRILKAPLSLIGSAMGQVFFQEASGLNNKNEPVQPLILKLYKKQFFIGFVPFLILFLWAPSIFQFVFGKQWTEAGTITQIITPWIFLNFIVSPVSSITVVFKKQKQAFLITIIDLLLKIVAVWAGYYFKNELLAFLLMSLSGSLLMVFDLFWYYHLCADNTI